MFGPLVFPTTFVKEKDEWVNSTAERLEDRGFHPKARKMTHWKPKEISLLKKTVEEIACGRVVPQTSNWEYYISHYVFHGSKSIEDVQGTIAQLARKKIGTQE